MTEAWNRSKESVAVVLRDWVVIYFYDDHHQEGQQTVVT